MTITLVPNQPKTPVHCIRCPDDLWAKAMTKAQAEGGNLSDVIRRALERYVRDEEGK